MNPKGFDRFVMRVSGITTLSALVGIGPVSLPQSITRGRGSAGAEGPGARVAQTPIDHIVINASQTAPPSTLFMGVTLALTAKGVCKDGTERKLSPVWRSSDPDIATVDHAGNITARKTGIVTITAESDGVRGTKTYAITKKPAEKFLIDLPNKPIRSGDIV